jgi:hypothetical protein
MPAVHLLMRCLAEGIDHTDGVSRIAKRRCEICRSDGENDPHAIGEGGSDSRGANHGEMGQSTSLQGGRFAGQ